MEGHLDVPVIAWIGFGLAVAGLLFADLVLFQRNESPTIRQSAIASAFWVSLALLFAAGIYWRGGSEAGLAYVTGYLVELSLSVDNIFVFVLIFGYFAVPVPQQRRVLLWGIIGIVVLRGIFIAAGTVLFESVTWISYPFGALLILSGVRLAFEKEKEPDLESKLTVRVFRRLVPTTSDFEGTRFVAWRAGKLLATPLLLVLVVLDITDVVFAVDSVPAVFSVTQDPYLVFTSNIAAVLGLRSLYFLVSGAVVSLRFLKAGLAAILAFVGIKMFIHDLYEVPTLASLAVIVGVIAIAGAASSLSPAPRDAESEGHGASIAGPLG